MRLLLVRQDDRWGRGGSGMGGPYPILRWLRDLRNCGPDVEASNPTPKKDDEENWEPTITLELRFHSKCLSGLLE
jgi:hypothetical protein